MKQKEDKKRNCNHEVTLRKKFGETQGVNYTLDIKRYQKYLDASDLTEDQKREFIEILWGVVVQFVMLSGGNHPLQQSGMVWNGNQRMECDPAIAKLIASIFDEHDKQDQPNTNLKEAWPEGEIYDI